MNRLFFFRYERNRLLRGDDVTIMVRASEYEGVHKDQRVLAHTDRHAGVFEVVVVGVGASDSAGFLNITCRMVKEGRGAVTGPGVA